MSAKRFAIFRPKQAPTNWGGNRVYPMSRKDCSIMDKHQTEPNPEHPGHTRYKIIESGLTYLDAYPKMLKLNEEHNRGQQTTDGSTVQKHDCR